MIFIMVMCAVAILLSIAMYGMEVRATAQERKFQERIVEIDINNASREAAREEEWAEARQELHEYFYEMKMEEAKAEAEEIQMTDSIFQEELEEVVETTKLESPAKAETEEPETMEETEDDITEQHIFFEKTKNSVEVQTTETECEKVEIEIIETDEPEELELEREEDDWFEPQPEVEAQSQAEPIPEPSVANTLVAVATPITYQENSSVSASLQNFLTSNGMTLEDFIIRMTCMVYPEACGESFVGKQGVAEVAINWIYSGLKTEWFDIASGFANIPVQRYYELWYSYNETDRVVIAECRQAVETVINGAHPVEDLLGVKPYYFLLPEKSDPINVYIMTQATYQLWVGNQLYLGMEGIDWTLKGN